MGSARRRGRDDVSFFTAEKPRFFKLILNYSVHRGRLGLPRKFVREYGNNLSDMVLLSVPTGAVWQVQLSKQDDRIWLQNGWQEFANYYSLDYGHVVAFEREVDNRFNVLIFDESGLEIEYPRYSGESSSKPTDKE